MREERGRPFSYRGQLPPQGAQGAMEDGVQRGGEERRGYRDEKKHDRGAYYAATAKDVNLRL